MSVVADVLSESASFVTHPAANNDEPFPRVKLIHASNIITLENQINDFLDTLDSFSSPKITHNMVVLNMEGDDYHTAMIEYFLWR